MISQPMAQDTDNKEQKIYSNNVEVVASGLVTDVSEINQPDGTQRYVLNGIHETVNKNINTLSNDYSNKMLDTTDVPLNTSVSDKDYLLGSVYLNDDEFVIFVLTYQNYIAASPTKISKICLFNNVTKRLSTLISDEESDNEDKLNFDEHHQIQAIYRLRRGCDRTIYFTDNFNVPRTINIDKLYNYCGDVKDFDTAVADKFNLIKTYNNIPRFARLDPDATPIYPGQKVERFGVEVKEGGKLLPGGYNLTIRLLDDDLNPTDWITTTDVIVVSNFDGDSQYTQMRGSTAKETDWQKFGETTKLIEVSVAADSIDTNFSYLQFGLIYANSGDGTVGGVNVSPMIGIEKEGAPDYYTYQFTGAVEYDKDTAESVSFGPINVGKAKTITSTQNRLLLGNVESKQVDWCKLQKYASKIAACVEVKTVELKDIKDKDNIASAIHNVEAKGYMPGEIYSFGIVYVFDDGTTSPAYHIPGGKVPSDDILHTRKGIVPEIGELGATYKSLDLENNECENVKYLDRSGCYESEGDPIGYWGVDCLGNTLKDKKVRHHRFPDRNRLGLNLFNSEHDYNCKKSDCEYNEEGSLDRGKPCRTEYYLEIPYFPVTNHYKRNHASFDIDIYLAIKNEDSGAYGPYPAVTPYYPDYRYDVEVVTKTIEIDDWDSSTGEVLGNVNNRYYRLDLGVYDYPPTLLGISEQPIMYQRGESESGIKYGWETTTGWQRIKYKKEPSGTDDKEFEPNPDSDFPLDEDGINLETIFYQKNTSQANPDKLRGKYRKNDFVFGDLSFAYIADYLKNNGKYFIDDNDNRHYTYYNRSVVNLIDTGVFRRTRNVKAKEDLIFEGCDSQYGTYSVPILGIHFWNIEMPSLKDTNNNKIIGYYIVRNKRDDDNKTVLDSAITFPLGNKAPKSEHDPFNQYLSAGFLLPNQDPSFRYSEEAIGFINPEFKYLKKKYKNFTFVREGRLNPIGFKKIFDPDVYKKPPCGHSDDSSIVSTCTYKDERVHAFKTDLVMEDVQAGSSYNKKENVSRGRRSEYDNDGFEMYSLIRERIFEYSQHWKATCKPSKIKYIDALDDTIMEDSSKLWLIHNISNDNAIGIMELGSDAVIEFDPNNTTSRKQQIAYFCKTISYGYLKLDVPNPYGNFRLMPYYRESKNLELFSDYSDKVSTSVFSGDVYVTPMKYWNSIFYNTRVRLRRRKSGVWRIVVGAISTAASIVGTAFASIFTGGAMLSTGIATVKASFSLMMSGIKMEKANNLYRRLYLKGLQSTLEDTWTRFFLKNVNPLDDQIQWLFEVSNSLWFESTINQFWRVGTSGDLPDFLEPLKLYNTQDYTTYITNKMTIADSERNNGRVYQGFASAEYYEVNPDYMRGNTQKAFYHLPIQYDCCSKCLERFPHRVMYSEVSFQEELTDNYTKFLALNYRDIPGETGEITNIFSVGSFLYIHTEEGLWNLPVGYQKLETAGLTTYLGNGQFFSTDPQKVGDLGFGNKYQHGFLMSKYGVFFVDEQYGRIYFMEKGKSSYGKETLGSPVSISDSGLTYWSKDNVKSFVDNHYQKEHGLHFPHLDNTANELGMGYLSVYDEKFERFIITKKDITPVFKNDSTYKDCTYLIFNGKLYDTDSREGHIPVPQGNFGWEFIGFKDNKALYQGKSCVTVSWHVEEPTRDAPAIYITDSISATPPTYTLTNKYIYFKYLDENSNELDATTLTNLGLTLGNAVELQFEINGTPDHSDISTYPLDIPLVEPSLFNSTIVPQGSVVTLTNLDSIINSIFAGSVQTNLGYTTYTINEQDGCDSSTTIEVTVNTSTNTECYLQVIKRFNNIPEGTTEGDIIEYFASSETLPLIINGETFPLVKPTVSSVEIKESETEEGKKDAVVTFDVLPVDCNTIAWQEGSSLTIIEDGLFDGGQMPIGYSYNSSYYYGSSNKTLVIVNEYEGGDDNGDDNGDEPQDLSKSLKKGGVLRDSDECDEGQPYEEQPADFEYQDCNYITAEVTLNEIPSSEYTFEDHSWTLSWNMKTQSWESFHSYLPNFYLGAKDTFYSYRVDEEGLWQHNIEGDFGKYYNSIYDFILDYVSVANNGIQTKVFNDVQVIADVKTYDASVGDYYDNNVRFFDKVVFSNSRQCSNEKDLIVKDAKLLDENYLLSQVQGRNEIIVDRNERNWSLNNIRDIVNKAANTPIWIKQYGNTDKVLNPNVFLYPSGQTPSWFDTNEIFRDKFLEIRFIFSNFVTVNEGTEEEPVYVDKNNDKITVYFLLNQENISVR